LILLAFGDGARLRVEYAGAIHHVMNRGDRREEIVRDEEDRARFVSVLEQACQKTGWQVHAWCLMSNHFHLVVETPRANLSAGMKWWLGTYTQRYNARHALRGHVFGGRFKSLLVDGRRGDYLRTVCDYVHLNPARAGLIPAQERLENYAWSSYPQYLRAARKRPVWLRVDRVMGEHGIEHDSAAGRRHFAVTTAGVRGAETELEAFKRIRNGWMFGRDDSRGMVAGEGGGERRGRPSPAGSRKGEKGS
jgi:putative transposase